jgi:hypothetical protein
MLLRGLLLVGVLTPICWLALMAALSWTRRVLPSDPAVEETLDAASRYAWAGGVFLALTLTATMSNLGVPPFAPAAEEVPPATPAGPSPSSGIHFDNRPSSSNIPAIEDMTDAEFQAFLAAHRGAPWLMWEETHHQVEVGGEAIPADRLAIDPAAYPQPAHSNGRGIHWIPTTWQAPQLVDTFVAEAQAMGMRWVVFLNGLADYELTANDYLVQRLVERGMEPVLRIESPVQRLDGGRVAALVAHYHPLGVHYYQIFNEPNLDREWGEAGAHSPERFADLWAEAATSVLHNGGLPGLAALSPGGDVSDYEYLERTLARLVTAGRYDLLNRAWLSVHNYTGGTPASFVVDETGFGRYRRYARICQRVLGAVLPMIGTEGGPAPADGAWQAQITPEQEARWIGQAFDYMATRREAYFLAYSPWLIANFAGGGHDARWEAAAWFQLGGPRPVVAALGGTAMAGGR